MRPPHGACGVFVLAAFLASTVSPGRASASMRAPGEDATSLGAKADAAHEAGRLSEAADLYAQAYRAMSAEEREAVGAFVVGVALDDLKAVWTATSDPAYAKKAAALLEEYESEAGTFSEELAAHRAWIEEAIAAAEPIDEPIADDGTSEPFGDEPQPPIRDHEAPARRDVVGPILVGVGAAAAVGGAVMVALGAPLGDEAERSRRDALADPRFLEASEADQQLFRMQYADYVSSEKKRGTGLVAGGAVLLVAGVGLATYGIVRLATRRRSPGTSARIRPIVGGFAF